MNSAGYDLSTLLKELANITDDQLKQLIEFIQILLTANQTTNLTAITDFDEAMVKHIYDSLLIMAIPEFQSANNIIDVGSGGGIPSIPLAICNPEKKIVSLEATQKKINFQTEAIRCLELKNLLPIWGRAEELAKHTSHREQYDLAIARAVAPLNILAELTIPFVKLQGEALFYKGKEAENELAKGEHAVKILGAEFSGIKSFTLPCNFGSRVIITFQKKQTTPSTYPRKPGIPTKKPL